MAAALLYLPANRAFNSNGIGVPGAVAELYLSGTTTPANFYSNSALSVSLGSSITANAAGRFSTAYQDETIPFRLIVKDASGAQLDDIDPFYFGSLYGSVISTASTSCASRTALAALTGAAGATARLTEAGREGEFAFMTAAAFLTQYGVALTTVVSTDTQQGLAVPPSTDTTGASGAWIRKKELRNRHNIDHYGAVADCIAIGTGTNNYAAINCAYNVASLFKGGEIFIPRNNLGYRVGSTLVFTGGVKILGQGFSQSPLATYPTAPQYIKGSMLVFDSNVAGMKFIAFTDNNADATAVEFESSIYSVMEDIVLFGGSGTTVTAHGIEVRAAVHFRNVRVDKFAGSGLRVEANTISAAVPYGNASLSKFDHCSFRENGLHGAHLKGTDSNAIKFDLCDFFGNGGLGVLDETGIGGNSYDDCHWNSNNASYGASTAQRTQVLADYAGLSAQAFGSIAFTSTNVPHSCRHCYIEDSWGKLAHLPVGVNVDGGLLAVSSYWDATSSPNGMDASNGTLRVGALKAPGSASTISMDPQIVWNVDRGWGGVASDARINWSVSGGLMMGGNGSSQDFTLFNASALSAIYVNHNSRSLNVQDSVDTVNFYKIGGVQVVKSRETGWAADTGTAKKTANATYTPGSTLTFSASYVQAEHTAVGTRLTAIENAIRDISQTQKSLKDALIAHGLIGA